ncbi:hypothetical protein BHE74_00014089 [Ensete ventricosum]|nr:hypothetical protein BHE74_00014089 [Ensete ventricosum]
MPTRTPKVMVVKSIIVDQLFKHVSDTHRQDVKNHQKLSLLCKNCLAIDLIVNLKPSKVIYRIETLLDFISSEAREGEIFTLLWMNGSGKYTLIGALTNHIVWESLHGPITLNDEKLLEVIFAYVMLDDILHPIVTMEETLKFSIEFQLL